MSEENKTETLNVSVEIAPEPTCTVTFKGFPDNRSMGKFLDELVRKGIISAFDVPKVN